MNLSIGTKEYFTSIDNQTVHFKCAYNPNASEVILFIHGLACSMDSFRNLFDKNYFPEISLLVIDLPGFGKSSKHESFSYSMQDQAILLESLLAKLPRWKYHLVAHSMGGAIALLFSEMFLNNLLSFTNVEGNLISEDCGILSRGIISHSFEVYDCELFPKQMDEFKDHDQLCFNKTNSYVTYSSAKSLVEWSDSEILLEKFRNLSCRKCYFYGEENKHMPGLEKLDFLETFMIKNCGHGMMTENPSEFYSKLANFINCR